MTPHIRPFVPNDAEQRPVVIDPTPGIATAAGYRPPTPAPYDYRKDPQRSANTYKRMALKMADLSGFFKSLPRQADLKLLLDIQRRSDVLIAAISANSMQSVAASYQAEVKALESGELARIHSDRWVSLEERQRSARDRNRVLDENLQAIITRETRPACLNVLREALELARAELHHLEVTERNLHQRYGIDCPESEVWRSVRDACENLAQAVDNCLIGFTGEVSPRGLLANFRINL
jgi:hypothetical protein